MAVTVTLFPSSQFLVSPPRSSSLSCPPPSNCTTNSVRFNKPCRITASATAERPRFTASRYMSFASTSCASTLYQDLGISMGASFEEIKSAYRKLARTCHPDVASPDASADKFMKIQAAYSTLSDPHKRMDYDRNLFRRSQSRSTGFSSFTSSPIYPTASGYTSARSWESDQCW